MPDAPACGRLLHTRVSLPKVQDQEGTARVVEADARVCGRVPVEDQAPPAWFVHLAIESIHPVDEKRLTETLRLLKAGEDGVA